MRKRISPNQVSFIHRPIVNWRGPARCARKPCQFGTGYSRTLNELRDELAFVGASLAVIQVDMSESMIRNDGLPRSTARAETSRVALSFEHPDQGAITMPCWTYEGWEENLRAIVLTLQSLRAVERYGAVTLGQQYRGFKELPATESVGDFSSPEDAAAFLLDLTVGVGEWTEGVRMSILGGNEGMFRRIYREACSITHPDRDTGSTEKFQTVQRAVDLIRKVTGWER